MSLFNELKRRNVFRVGIAYVVVAWLVLQVADIILNNVDAPGWVFHVILLLLGIGLLLALVFAWAFEMTPQGLKRESEVDRSQSITPQTGKKLNHVIMTLMALGLGYFSYDKFFLSNESEVTVEAVGAQTEPQSQASAAVPEDLDKSIAVLPFVNMSTDPEQEYFSDGISEELLNRLAQIPDLKVAARTSAFQFKGRNLDIGAIGQQLNVAHILEGSVRKGGTTLRITAQLIDSRSGFHLWSETYDRDATDVLKVQDEIATAIASALQSELGVKAIASPVSQKINPAAYDFYLQARTYVARRWLENLTLAVNAFDQALEIDPEYSAAWSGRAFAHFLQPLWGVPPGNTLEIALESSEKALVLDPGNAEAYMTRGMVANFSLEVTLAKADLDRALALAPGNVDIINMYGDFQIYAGALGEAERLKRLAMTLDPLAFVHPLNLADILTIQGRHEESVTMAEQAVALGATNYGLERVFFANLRAGHLQDAESAMEKACVISGSSGGVCESNRIMLLFAKGDREQAEELLEQLVSDIDSGQRPAGSYGASTLVPLFVEVSSIERATAMQNRVLEQDDWFPTFALVYARGGAKLPEEISDDPDWLSAWNDPRIADLMMMYRQNLLAWRASQNK